MENLLWIVPVSIFAVISFVLIFLFIYKLYKREKLDREFNEEMMRRLPEVEYTKIISSVVGNTGFVGTVNTDGKVGIGSYGADATTKFLVVYKSGYKQIVHLKDGIPLFNEYVKLLKD